jgi:hypothetical protein
MDQDQLNKVRMDEWDTDGRYEEKFRLKLTVKHALVVGKWQADGEWGVDLRRWSYDMGRLLGEGISLKSDAWEWLYGFIHDLYESESFSRYGASDRTTYEKMRVIGNGFSLSTCVFDEGRVPYFCVNMMYHGSLVWRGRGTALRIMIRFNTISDFLAQAENSGLSHRREKPRGKKRVDPKTGKEIF